MKLTLKQKKFADEYIKSGNITQAAVNAGYSKKTARVIGQENLLKPAISEYIAERMAQIDKANIAEQKEILEFMTRVMRRQETEQVTNVLKKPTLMTVNAGEDNEYQKIVNEEVVEVTEIKSSTGDAVRAADLLSKLIKYEANSTSFEEDKARKMKADADMAEARVRLMNDDRVSSDAKIVIVDSWGDEDDTND